MTEEHANLQAPLVVNVKVKRRRRFKAGAELSSAVNRVNLEVWEEKEEDSETLSISIHMEQQAVMHHEC